MLLCDRNYVCLCRVPDAFMQRPYTVSPELLKCRRNLTQAQSTWRRKPPLPTATMFACSGEFLHILDEGISSAAPCKPGCEPIVPRGALNGASKAHSAIEAVQMCSPVGHILRRDETFTATCRRILMGAQKPYEEGPTLMDAPEHNTMAELAKLAQDSKSWQACYWYYTMLSIVRYRYYR